MVTYNMLHKKQDLLGDKEDLVWLKHIATMTNTANAKLSFLRRNLKGCPEKINLSKLLTFL